MNFSWMIGKKVNGFTLSSNPNGSTTGLTIHFEDGSEVSVSENYIEGFGWSGINIYSEQKKDA